MENVAALVSQKFIGTFNQWQLELERYGYTNFAQVLNAKDYGVPQNRERIFMISILDCEDAYYFPKKMKLTKRLKDVLEENVDEKYYLSDKMLEGFMMHNEKHQSKGTGFLFEPTDGGGTAKCLRANAALAPTDNAIIDTTKPIGGGNSLSLKISSQEETKTIHTIESGKKKHTAELSIAPKKWKSSLADKPIVGGADRSKSERIR